MNSDPFFVPFGDAQISVLIVLVRLGNAMECQVTRSRGFGLHVILATFSAGAEERTDRTDPSWMAWILEPSSLKSHLEILRELLCWDPHLATASVHPWMLIFGFPLLFLFLKLMHKCFPMRKSSVWRCVAQMCCTDVLQHDFSCDCSHFQAEAWPCRAPLFNLTSGVSTRGPERFEG